MRRQREKIRLTAVLILGEGVALGVVLAVLIMYVGMSLGGYYEILVCTNVYGEHYVELALLCVSATLVTVDIARRSVRLRRLGV
ncbi:unnamed protein product [marine sediment metagenome]|uniref:ABC3 transporter permease protein domain-containing protein n=1 Tax=marine sediment metagenome TaxID=412755 RepID=X1PSQ8_9ZZZZ